jgi:hypothetical protein
VQLGCLRELLHRIVALLLRRGRCTRCRRRGDPRAEPLAELPRGRLVDVLDQRGVARDVDRDLSEGDPVLY